MKNFLVYFWVDEETMEVQVASIPGSKRVFGAKSQVYGEICDDLSGSGICADTVCTNSMDDHPSIGLLLCKSKNDLVAEYALKDMSKPMGVSAYKVTSSLPEELQRQLPSIEDIEKRIQKE